MPEIGKCFFSSNHEFRFNSLIGEFEVDEISGGTGISIFTRSNFYTRKYGQFTKQQTSPNVFVIFQIDLDVFFFCSELRELMEIFRCLWSN